MVNKRVQYTEGLFTEPLPNPTAGLQYLRRNIGNTGWELVTLNPGVANLGEVLANGNTTDGYDIELSIGDAITSADGYVNVSGHLSVSNGLDVSNKKITSVLDPTSPQDAATKNYVDTHIIPLTSIAPANVDKTAAVVGVSGTAARSDHKHNISTAIAVSVGNNDAEGTATTLARSDHMHAVTDLRMAAQAQGDILYFNGSNWVVLPPSIDGYVLTTHSSGENPTWEISQTPLTPTERVIVTLIDDWLPTDIIHAPAPEAQYLFKAYLEILIAGTFGKLIVNEIHTGPSGTVQTTPVTGPIDITTIGNAGQGVVALATNGTGAIQYSVSTAPGIFTKGPMEYALRISLTQEPN
jgi:hypothetical protein